MVFIQGTRFTRGGGTNRKGAAGSGRFRVGNYVHVRNDNNKIPLTAHYGSTGTVLVNKPFVVKLCKTGAQIG